MEMTLAKLQRLIACKAPIVGIPRLADKPFALQRTRLAGVIEGLESCEVSLNQHLEIEAPGRQYKLYGLDMRKWTEAYKILRQWVERQRARKESPKLSTAEKRKSELLRRIALAERKARQLAPCRPYNPVLEIGDTASAYEREQWAAWVAHKPLCRKIGRLATAHGLHHGSLPDAVIRQPRKLYEALFSFTHCHVAKYGELHRTARRDKPTEAQYLKHLYEYVGRGPLSASPRYGIALRSNPYRSNQWRTPEHIQEDRRNYCQRMRDWRNAEETVHWLRAQLVSFEIAQDDNE